MNLHPINIVARSKKILAWVWLIVLAAIAALGFALVLRGTRISSVDRFLIPPEILPGLAILCVGSLVGALTVAKFSDRVPQLKGLRNWISSHIGKPEREKQRNMFLVLTVLLLAFSMTSGTTPMYRFLVMNFVFSAFLNLLISSIAALGLFGWMCSFLISIKPKGKS